MRIKAILLGSAAALAAMSSAHAAQNGFYAGVEGGVSWVQGVHVFETRNAGLTTFQDHISFNTGWAVLATAGYEWDHWRMEAEAGYRQNDMDVISFNTGFVSSDIDNFSEFTLMANLIYDIPLTQRLSFSVGGGVGADRTSFDWPGFGANGLKDDQWRFAWQLIAGANYSLSSDSEVFVDYRFLGVNGPEYSQGNYRFDFDNLDKHLVTLGLRYHFGA
jgi:opacity protein-like surface antigen